LRLKRAISPPRNHENKRDSAFRGVPAIESMSGMKQERGRERYGSTNLVGKAGRKEEQHANHGERGHEEGGEKETASESKTSTKSGGADDWNIPAETAGFKPDGWNRGKFDSWQEIYGGKMS